MPSSCHHSQANEVLHQVLSIPIERYFGGSNPNDYNSLRDQHPGIHTTTSIPPRPILRDPRDSDVVDTLSKDANCKCEIVKGHFPRAYTAIGKARPVEIL